MWFLLGSSCAKSSRQGCHLLRSEELMAKAKFLLGRMVATPGALAALSQANQDPLELLARHQQGDWGELSEEDKRENEFS
jgi:hypothetical protein